MPEVLGHDTSGTMPSAQTSVETLRAPAYRGLESPRPDVRAGCSAKAWQLISTHMKKRLPVVGGLVESGLREPVEQVVLVHAVDHNLATRRAHA